MRNKIIGSIICAIKRDHEMFIGPDFEKWRAETERQMKAVGYCDCFCDRCGKRFMRITLGQEVKE